MIPHFPYGRTRRVKALVAEPEPIPAETTAPTTEAKAEMTYAQMLQSLREAPPMTRARPAADPPIDPITQIAREAADAYDKRTGHDWTEYGLIDAVLAAVTPAIRDAR